MTKILEKGSCWYKDFKEKGQVILRFAREGEEIIIKKFVDEHRKNHDYVELFSSEEEVLEYIQKKGIIAVENNREVVGFSAFKISDKYQYGNLQFNYLIREFRNRKMHPAFILLRLPLSAIKNEKENKFLWFLDIAPDRLKSIDDTVFRTCNEVGCDVARITVFDRRIESSDSKNDLTGKCAARLRKLDWNYDTIENAYKVTEKND